MPKVKQQEHKYREFPPALTLEDREGQLIALAYDVVEQRLRDGTATSQETTHFLKLGSTKHMMEMEKLEEENKLIRSKVQALESQVKNDEMYADVLRAMKKYTGHSCDEEDY